MKLELRNLLKDFAGEKAVNNVDTTVRGGALTGLLGPSGCGKSTLLYLIAGLEAPTAGSIVFNGKDVTALPPEKRGIGLVFQNYALYPHMTVERNIRFPLDNQKLDREEKKRRTREMARLVQVEEYLDRMPAQLSGGQQQRVAIARALVKRPQILLLDEPLSNLDAKLRQEMREEIRRIQTETGVTTIFVTHDQEDAMSITDEIILMDHGVIHQQDAPQKMYLQPKNRFVAGFLGNPSCCFFNVEARDGQIALQGGYGLRLKKAHSGLGILGIRPEWWKLGEGITVTAQNVEIRGRDALVTFLLNGVRARAVLDITEAMPAGSELTFALKQDSLLFFHPETGERLDWEVAP